MEGVTSDFRNILIWNGNMGRNTTVGYHQSETATVFTEVHLETQTFGMDSFSISNSSDTEDEDSEFYNLAFSGIQVRDRSTSSTSPKKRKLMANFSRPPPPKKAC